MPTSPTHFTQQPVHRTRGCTNTPQQTRASLSCPPLGPPAHPLHIVSFTLLGNPRVYPLVSCTVLEDLLLLWLPCLHPLWSHPHTAFL